MIITLNPAQFCYAAGLGADRNAKAILANRCHRYGMSDKEGWANHIEGACGEFATALALGIEFDGTINTFKTRPDLPGIEVRWALKRDGALVYRPDDKESDAFVLTRRPAPNVEVVGWLFGYQCQRKGVWADPGNRGYPAWFVSGRDVNTDLDELKRWVDHVKETSLAAAV